MQAMNQMFVIDIYLNKFKNHFCSINPRFFRYFACGLNGYVGMIDFNSHQWIKYGFVAFAVADCIGFFVVLQQIGAGTDHRGAQQD